MNKQMTKNKIFFGLGTIGRDALYSLVSMYLMVHLTDVVTFTDGGLAVIGVMLTLFGIFDAVIDPFVGTIIDNTKTKWGKFKPWILIGMIGTGLLTALLFHDFKMSESWHIVLLGVTYLLFSIFFSLNDIAYWSLMPAISKDQKVREGVGSFARICANIGMFAMVLIYPSMEGVFRGMGFTGSLRTPFFVFAIIASAVMWIFQIFTLVGVKEDRTQLATVERTTLKDLCRALFKNDQLLVAAVSMALFMSECGNKKRDKDRDKSLCPLNNVSAFHIGAAGFLCGHYLLGFINKGGYETKSNGHHHRKFVNRNFYFLQGFHKTFKPVSKGDGGCGIGQKAAARNKADNADAHKHCGKQAFSGNGNKLPFKNRVAFHKENIEHGGKDYDGHNGLYALDNKLPWKFGKSIEHYDHCRTYKKGKKSVCHKKKNDVCNNKQKLHSGVKAVNNGFSGEILAKGDIFKHLLFPLCQEV